MYLILKRNLAVFKMKEAKEAKADFKQKIISNSSTSSFLPLTSDFNIDHTSQEIYVFFSNYSTNFL